MSTKDEGREREMRERIQPRRVPPNGLPCNHPGCLSHVSHPCEGCGRIAGRTSTARSTPPVAWRPIETAPKDGTKILATGVGLGRWTDVVWWFKGKWRDEGKGYLKGISHWMPLPVSPDTHPAPQDTESAEVERLRETLRKDAMRYRWLRDTLHGAKAGGGVEVNTDLQIYEQPIEGEEVWVYWYQDTPVGFYESKGSTLDEAIDRALHDKLKFERTETDG